MNHTIENRFYRLLLKVWSGRQNYGDYEKLRVLLKKFFIDGHVKNIDFENVERSIFKKELTPDQRTVLLAFVNNPVACLHAINGKAKGY